MKKRLLALGLCVMMVLSLAGCNKKEEVVTQPSETQETESSSSEEVTEEVSEEPVDENMIKNGDFAEGVGTWMTYLNGGEGTISVNADGQLVIDVAKVGNLDYSVQAYYDGIVLDQGVVYKFAFDMATTVPRTVVWRIQLNGGDYSAYFTEEITSTTEMQHYEYEIKMEQPSDPAPRLCFNVGTYEPDGELGAHQIMLDNFEYKVLDASGKVAVDENAGLPMINVNQVGYLPDMEKKATFRGDTIGTAFTVVNAESGEVAYEGTITGEGDNASSGEVCAVGDFTELKTPGTYKIVNDGCGESFTFTIGDDVYKSLLDDTLRMMYMQRCGCELPADLAGDFAHPVCHATDAVVYGTSTKKDVSGGWHDAGDYGRYVVSGAKTVADLLLAYEAYPSVFGDDLNIPESGNGVPDVLDEVRFELEWMLKMQETNGGVYHKVTCRNFPGTVMPQEETEELVISPISNTATADFAAVMAMAGRFYEKYDAAFAKKCLAAAESALAYYEANKSAPGFKNPSDVVTGEYPDDDATDEYVWALAELYKTTGNKKYEDTLKGINTDSLSMALGWQGVGVYGAYTYCSIPGADASLKGKMQAKIDFEAQKLEENRKADAYDSTMGNEYPWGSNMTIANNGMIYLMTGNKSGAQSQLSYLLGNNTNSYCFVTGYGTLSPTGTHHRPSQALKTTMQGMLVGGPNSNLEDPYAQQTLKDKAPARCYVDNEQSYSCNEITVYWNSPLVYLLAGICAK